MLRTWCAHQTPDMEDISLPQLSSEEEWAPKKLMNKCSTSRTRTPLTSLSGFPTTSSHLSVISHPRVSRWPSHSLETQLLSKKCSRELESNSLLCSEEKPSSIGTPEKAWTRWNSLKLKATWTTWSLSTSNIRMLLLRTKKKWTKRKWNEPAIVMNF